MSRMETSPQREGAFPALLPRWSEMMDRLFTPVMWRGDGPGQWMPDFDLKESADAVEVTAELPGLKPDDVDIQVSGDVLTISGEKKSETKRDEGQWHVVERSFGKFSRSFTLPAAVQRESVDAQMKDGVLTIKMAKAKQAQPHKIKIR